MRVDKTRLKLFSCHRSPADPIVHVRCEDVARLIQSRGLAEFFKEALANRASTLRKSDWGSANLRQFLDRR